MTAQTTTATRAWDDAVRRATAVANSERPGGMDEDCWDDVAIRDIIATVLYALHLRTGTEADTVPWSSVLWWLHDDERVVSLVEDTVPGAAQALAETTAGTEEAVLDRWRWLNRTWDPDAPVRRLNRPSSTGGTLRQTGHDRFGSPVAVAEPRWDGLSRAIAGGVPDPALEVCTHWAAGAVASVLSAECNGFAIYQRVHVMAGDFAGRRGYVQDLGWIIDDEEQQLTGPAGYIVDLDGTEGTTPIDAEDLKAIRDDRWARRPAGTLKDGSLPGWGTPLPPSPSCGEDLEELLGRAGNPDAVPEELRQSIRDAHSHHHLDIRRLARPRPHRATAQLLLHWYQLTDRYVDGPDGRAELWEVVLTEHLRDEAPTRLLATNEQAAKALAEHHTGLKL
ncbi:hypothetical protein OG241_06630 [Streptomyces sp. NBC_01390]|uniref:hypothetical protein n=1 Tax=Streptomyces sp. NBC_01390 TaxID=2903850 RepID=UPI00324D23D6